MSEILPSQTFNHPIKPVHQSLINPERTSIHISSAFNKQSLVDSCLNRKRKGTSSSKFQKMISQQKQKLELYKNKVKSQSKRNHSIKILKESVNPKITNIVDRITSFAQKLSKLQEIEHSKIPLRRSSNHNQIYSSNLRSQYSMKQFPSFPTKQQFNYQALISRSKELLSKPTTSKNRIKILFDNQRAKQIALKSQQTIKKLNRVKSGPQLMKFMNATVEQELIKND